MKDEGKTKRELLAEIQELRRKNDELAKLHKKEQSQLGCQGTETILVVDDDDAFRHAAAKMLSFFGYRVIEARSGKEGIQVFANNEGDIDLVLTDLVMPDMNGSELVANLLKIRPGIKVLFMSGHIRMISSAMMFTKSLIQTETLLKNLSPGKILVS